MLAWRRLTTGRNLAYKRFFRRLYYSYEVALDLNLRDLHARLNGGSWQPQQPTKVYVPKPSGLQRPLTLLGLEDQIVLQAIANVFAKKVFGRRRRLELNCVFSNILQHGRSSIFFLEDWRFSYAMFRDRVEEHFNEGYHWIAHFDLAAYYDTICHDLLMRTVFPRTTNENRDHILAYLKKWSAERSTSSHGHGIPQGPIASDFLAECFFLPIDETLKKQNFRFVRYVDDIRLFAKTENQLRKAAIHMEIMLRGRGLIPQGKKHSIEKAKSLKDAMGILPSIEPSHDMGDPIPKTISERDALDKFRGAISGKPFTIIDKTRARFILYRASPSRRLLGYVLRLMPRHPEHVDAFVHHLTQYKRSPRIISHCIQLMQKSPYEYVRGEMWHILAQMLRPVEMRRHLSQAVADAKDKKTGLALKWGALHFLCMAERAGLGNYGKFVMYQDNTLLQAFIAPVLPDSRYVKGDVVTKLLRRTAFEPGIALAEQLVRLKISLKHVGLTSRSLASQTRNVLKALGIIKTPLSAVDPLGEILERRYGIQSWTGWKTIFGQDYSHALQLLSIADTVYDSGRSQWLSYQNSFNHSLFLAFQEFLDAKGLPGIVKTVDRNGNLIKFGILVEAHQPFAKSYPCIAKPFAFANTRRNVLPGSHPYELKGGARAVHLRKAEQVAISPKLGKAYIEIIKAASVNP